METRKVATKNLSEVFSILDQSNRQHIVLVKGSTGIGKTELLKQIAYCWAGGVKDCNLLTESDFVFLLYLKDREVQKIDNLEKLICYFYRYSNSKYIESYVNKLEEKQGRSVVFLLDGYDEYPTKLKRDGFIANLLQRYVLPYCSIVISSRPHASQMLYATFEVEIVGFDEKGQNDFFQKSLVVEPDNISQLDTYRGTDPAITSFCSIPLNMSVLVAMFKQESMLPTNSTKLHNLLICEIIHRNAVNKTKERKELKEKVIDITDFKNLPEEYSNISKLSKLAFKAFKKNRLTISLRKIRRAYQSIDISPHNTGIDNVDTFGLLKPTECSETKTKNPKYTFTFTSVQEFLAACYIINLPEITEELSAIKETYYEDNYLNVISFYISLTKGKREALRMFVHSMDEKLDRDDTKEFLKNILLYKCFNESSDTATCRIIENRVEKIINLFSHMLSGYDIVAIGTLITQSCDKQWNSINLAGCHIQDAGIKIIHRFLQVSESSVIIRQLWLCKNDLTSSSNGYLIDIVKSCEVEFLDISSNHGLGQKEELFHSMLSLPKLQTLHIDDVNLSSNVAIAIFTILMENKTNLKKLDISNTAFNYTDEVCDIIGEALQANNKLRFLKIYSNDLPEHVIESMLTAIQKNTSNALRKLILPPNCTKDFQAQQILLVNETINMRRKQNNCKRLCISFEEYLITSK